MVLGGCGWFWVVVDVFGWLWMVLGGCGWFWVVPRFSKYVKVMHGSLHLNNNRWMQQL